MPRSKRSPLVGSGTGSGVGAVGAVIVQVVGLPRSRNCRHKRKNLLAFVPFIPKKTPGTILIEIKNCRYLYAINSGFSMKSNRLI